MSKIGLGVGEDFPIEDKDKAEGAGPDCGEEWDAYRSAFRRARTEWRSARSEWRAKRRAYRERMRAELGARGYSRNAPVVGYALGGFLAVALVVGAVSLVIWLAPLLIFGALAFAVYWFFIQRDRDYDWHDANMTKGPPAPPAGTPAPPAV